MPSRMLSIKNGVTNKCAQNPQRSLMKKTIATRSNVEMNFSAVVDQRASEE